MIDVQKLADLARMAVRADEQEIVAKDLETIIHFVDIVQSRTVSNPEPVLDKVNVFREDKVNVLAAAYDLVEAAPDHQDGFVKVPKIIGG